MSSPMSAPTPGAPDPIIKSAKQLAEWSTDLLDSDVAAATKIVVGLQNKYGCMANTVENLERLRDESLTKLAEIGILATFDPTPCFHGEPPVVEFLGKVGGMEKDGFDHEQKGYEVRKSIKRGEDFLGQKERANVRVPKGKRKKK